MEYITTALFRNSVIHRFDAEAEAGRQIYLALSNTATGIRDITVGGAPAGATIEMHGAEETVLIAIRGDQAAVLARYPVLVGTIHTFRLDVLKLMADSLGYVLHPKGEPTPQEMLKEIKIKATPKRRRRKVAKKKVAKKTAKKKTKKTAKKRKRRAST